MSSRQRLFGWFYRLGFAPWDGHPLSGHLVDMVAGSASLTPSAAIDIGCGTGDNSILLAEHGWQVTGVDFIATPLVKAGQKAAAKGLRPTFIQADATRLSTESVGSGFSLAVDSGCLHGMSADDRDAYVRELAAITVPNARLFIAAFLPGRAFGVPGISEDEVAARFGPQWTLLASGSEPSMDSNGKDPARFYDFQKKP